MSDGERMNEYLPWVTDLKVTISYWVRSKTPSPCTLGAMSEDLHVLDRQLTVHYFDPTTGQC